jgi:glutamate racemase
MKPLTIEYAIEHKLTAIDCVRYFKPELSIEQCDIFIWECTAFPFSKLEGLINQLNEHFIKE